MPTMRNKLQIKAICCCHYFGEIREKCLALLKETKLMTEKLTEDLACIDGFEVIIFHVPLLCAEFICSAYEASSNEEKLELS